MAARCPGYPVVFTGYQDDVTPWLRDLEIYVQPSLNEGFGTSVLDAMACRLPVIASRVGGLPEIVIHGSTGLLVPPAQPSQLSGAIRQLLAEPARASAMGQAGRERVEEHFSVASMVDAYLDLYRGLH